MSSQVPLPHMISGLSEIAADYDVLVCDIWGVLHDGQSPFPDVDEALGNFRNKGGKVLLLSNAPRPGETALKRLDTIGNKRSSYDDILTSGDATRALLIDMAEQGKKACHIGPDKDADLVADLTIELVEMAEADVVLFSGMYDDMNETPDDYAGLLTEMQARNLAMICPNPDRTAQFGGKILYCAGAVAEKYENNGGEVIWIGKPYERVYSCVRAMAQSMTGLETPRLLAIGDGPKTDIPGAQAAGIDALFIAGGIAGASGAKIDTAQDIAALLSDENTQSRFAMRHLAW